ncbi:outer membrane beta-barrel protein [Thermodesulfobacteriota bacterium]
MKYAIIFCLLLLPAHAYGMDGKNWNRGWYAGLGRGVSIYDKEDASATLDDTDSSITLFGGYRFNRFLAVQGNFADLGEYTEKGSVIESTEMACLSFTAVGLLPIARSGIDLFGRLGLGIMNYTQNVNLFGLRYENSDSGQALVAALGVNYTHPTLKRITFHVASDYYYFETTNTYSTSNDTESHLVTVFGLGARFNF